MVGGEGQGSAVPHGLDPQALTSGRCRWCVEKIDEPSPEKFKLKDPELDGVPSPYAPKPTKKQRTHPKLSLGLASPTPYILPPLAAFCSASHTDGTRGLARQRRLSRLEALVRLRRPACVPLCLQPPTAMCVIEPRFTRSGCVGHHTSTRAWPRRAVQQSSRRPPVRACRHVEVLVATQEGTILVVDAKNCQARVEKQHCCDLRACVRACVRAFAPCW